MDISDVVKQQTPGAAPPAGDATPLPGYLAVSTNVPQLVVYVADFTTSQGPLAGFGLTESGPFFAAGVQWRAPAGGKLEVTWKLMKGVIGLSPKAGSSITFTEVTPGQLDSSLSSVLATYGFNVEFSGGRYEDPQIIISPG